MADITDREMLVDLCEMFERVESEHKRHGGMSVPYFGPFAAVVHHPSVVQDVRVLARRLRYHLTRTAPRSHDVEWLGIFRGTDSDPRECGWCAECGRDVYDGDGTHAQRELDACGEREACLVHPPRATIDETVQSYLDAEAESKT